MASGSKLETFNGWIPPSRLDALRDILQQWTNFILQRQYTRVKNIEQDLSDSVVILHLCALVMDLDMFNLPVECGTIVPRPATKEAMQQNLDVCFRVLKSQTGNTMTFVYSPAKIVEGDIQACFTILLTLSRVYYMRVLFEQRSQAVQLYRDNLISLVINTLKRGGAPAELEVTNFTTDWQDGMLLCFLVWTHYPTAINLPDARAMSPTRRIQTAQRVAMERFGTPALLGASGEAMRAGDGDAIPLYLSALLHSFDASTHVDQSQQRWSPVCEENDRLKSQLEAMRQENQRLQAELTRANEASQQLDDHDLAYLSATHDEMRVLLETKDREIELYKSRVDEVRLEMRGQLSTALQTGRELAEKLREVEQRVQGEHLALTNLRGPVRDNGVSAPSGNVTIMFTDIQGSTMLWEENALAMASSLQMHNTLFRTVIKECGGYEVKTEGDSFMIAFQSPIAAVRCALRLQDRLMHVNWPHCLTDFNNCKTETDVLGETLFRGLRVRMGLHIGQLTPEREPLTGRFDYLGPVVNRAARVSSCAVGGQVLLSDTLYDIVANSMSELDSPTTSYLGERSLKGLRDPIAVYQILPRHLSARIFIHPDEKQAVVSNSQHVVRLQREIQNLHDAHEQLMQKLESIEQRFNMTIQQTESCQADFERLNTSGGADTRTVDGRLEQLTRLTTDQRQLRAELESAKSKMQSMSDKTGQMDTEVAHLQQIILKLRTEGVTPADPTHASSFLEMARAQKRLEEDRDRLRKALMIERGKVDQLSADCKRAVQLATSSQQRSERQPVAKPKFVEPLSTNKSRAVTFNLSDLDTSPSSGLPPRSSSDRSTPRISPPAPRRSAESSPQTSGQTSGGSDSSARTATKPARSGSENRLPSIAELTVEGMKPVEEGPSEDALQEIDSESSDIESTNSPHRSLVPSVLQTAKSPVDPRPPDDLSSELSDDDWPKKGKSRPSTHSRSMDTVGAHRAIPEHTARAVERASDTRALTKHSTTASRTASEERSAAPALAMGKRARSNTDVREPGGRDREPSGRDRVDGRLRPPSRTSDEGASEAGSGASSRNTTPPVIRDRGDRDRSSDRGRSGSSDRLMTRPVPLDGLRKSNTEMGFRTVSRSSEDLGQRGGHERGRSLTREDPSTLVGASRLADLRGFDSKSDARSTKDISALPAFPRREKSFS